MSRETRRCLGSVIGSASRGFRPPTNPARFKIGQERPVLVHRLVTLGSIEEKMETLKERKRALLAAVLQAGAGGVLHLSESDVEAVFAAE